MSQTLYRKYRSQRFSELVGQDTATRVLRNALQRDRVSHAYLLCGPRGTGKTSVARIFAKALNCPHAMEGDCCGDCDICVAIAQGTAVDVIEMDAASNRGIDDVRDLSARVQRGPLELKRKVYIIDEVHMITREGFNALLKTLEEPPAHVVFCLCTTDPGKLPVTILSRCIRLEFQRLSLPLLSRHLCKITALEGMSLESEAADELARLAEGSARDAISLLDQLAAYCESRIELQDVRTLFQLGDHSWVKEAADAIEQESTESIGGIWEEVAKSGTDYQRFLLHLAAEARERYLSTGAAGWRRVLDVLWTSLSLLKHDAYPALLLQLALLEAQSAFVNGGRPAAEGDATSRMPTRSKPSQVVQPPGHEHRQTTGMAEASRAPQASGTMPGVPPKSSPEAAGVIGVPQTAADEIGAAAAPNSLDPKVWEAFLVRVQEMNPSAASHIRRPLALGSFNGSELTIAFEEENLSDFRSASRPWVMTFLSSAAAEVFGAGATLRLRCGSHVSTVDGTPQAETEDARSDMEYDSTFKEGDSGKYQAVKLMEGSLQIERQLANAATEPVCEGGDGLPVETIEVGMHILGFEYIEEERQ